MAFFMILDRWDLTTMGLISSIPQNPKSVMSKLIVSELIDKFLI
jgi:hypothetical protein